MKPVYSILYFMQQLEPNLMDIGECLSEGIKVFWFGTQIDMDILKDRFAPYISAFFLQCFDTATLDTDKYRPTVIIDGEGINSEYKQLLDFLEEKIFMFNAAQYRVEHCQADANIVVKASAGTGKTTVMIDRILYLMHTVPDLDMSEIYMITFTNEATNQMNHRLQEMLLKKYSLTKNKRYLKWLEQQSQMHISTIDSLAYDLFRRYGMGVGFGRDLGIQPLEKERKDLIKDLLSEELSDQKSINEQIGMSYSEAGRLIDDYWKEITRKGYTISDVLSKDWGEAGSDTAGFQRVIRKVLEQFEEKYRQIKLDANAISINDLFFDFGHYLLEDLIDCDGLDMKFLFVDEFQDTDATQIRTFAKLVQRLGAGLFVVGDVKQSIYAFKGATDAAFDILHEEMKGKLTYFSLRNNYRTCSNLMKLMEKYFFAWSGEGLLKYEESVRPFNKNTGEIIMELIERKDDFDPWTIAVIQNALESLELDIRSGRKKADEKAKVAVLVRGTKRGNEIAGLCRSKGITVVLNSDEPFFLSDAVRDFYAMISSYIFADHPVYLYNYLMTPYARYDGVINVSEMEKYSCNRKELMKYLRSFSAQTKWMEYQREFRIRPVLSVIKDIVEEENVIDTYIALDKVRMYGDNWTEAGKNKQAFIDAKRYRMNLDKLMEMIQQRMDGEFTTLYDLYVYLTLMIASNREEKEPDIDMADDYTSVYIMTVHKSKGLEFDTVVMPSMNGGLMPMEMTKILMNKKKVAWYFDHGTAEAMKSAWYSELRDEDIEKGVKEEVRILYVAMTRAINKLVMLVNNRSNYESWSSLIRKVGLINE